MITDSLLSYNNAMWGTLELSHSAGGNTPVRAPSEYIRQAASEGGSQLGKRDAEGAPRRRAAANRVGSRYRGVTHHARTNRYEAHLWDDGKQLYLGGFYNEEQAALAYDLAAIRFRGDDAATNFPIERYHAELAARREVTREQVVACLRDQSKAMNKMEAAAEGARMAPWELALSAALACDKVHLGVYGTELEAARSYDRALVGAQGLEAAGLLNFQLVDYLDMLTPDQLAAGISRGLLPSALPYTFAPSALPRPLPDAGIEGLLAGCLPALSSPDEAGAMENAAPGHGATMSAAAATGGATPQQQVPRRKSITPRSVLDGYDEGQAQGQQGKAAAGGGQQLPGDVDAMQSWVDALTL